MKTPALFSLITFLSLSTLPAQQSDYPDLEAKAEAAYTEGSYAKAHDIYQQAKGITLTPAESRWVDFRLADTLWRLQAATQNADSTKIDEARHALEVLVRDITRTEDHDRVWAEVEESLGDFFWARRNFMSWGEAWPHYQQALDWWSGATDLDLARKRYLKIVWTATWPPSVDRRNYYFGSYGNMLPLDILENALKIAQTDDDKAHAHYLIAMTLRQQGGWEEHHRVPDEFEAAIKPGKKTDWYDDALYNYAEWMSSYGRMVPQKDGNWSQEPDYVKALALFRQLVKDFQKGETRYYDQAQQQIRNITDPQVQVGVANIFLPDSEIQYTLNWRNVKHLDLALYPVDLTRDVKFTDENQDRGQWLQTIDLGGREKIKSWSRETEDKGDYKPGSDNAHLNAKLPPGAYVLEAQGGGKSARDLVLVSDATLVLKVSGKQALVYACNALAGSPLAETTVHLWERYYEDQHWHWRDASRTANADGIAVFDLRDANNEQLFVSTIIKDRQSFSAGDAYSYYGNRQRDGWKIYAFTDRPAYRPKETVQWKFLARRDRDSVYTTPSDQTIEYQIDDPRGTAFKSDKVKLNAFGSAWGSLEVPETAPLGEYRVTFWDEGRKHNIGNATLFRVEEYKLPEFKVSVETPEENGRKKAFRLGEQVTVNIQSDYYFGGPVANASVEVLVYQNPFYHYWHRPHSYPWYYEDMSPGYQRGRYWYGGQGQIIKRETIKTDATGKASLSFDTPANAGQDFEYRIEARVTDSSRREITGSSTVRVTSQRYYVYPEPEHNLYRPQDKVTVDFKAQDANDQPVVTEGIVKVTRDYWYEIWLDPNGREVKGDELKRLRSGPLIFPPPPLKPDDRPWELKFRGYEKDEILTRTLKTDTNGVAQLTFTPERDGYYRVAWSSEDNATNSRPAPPITAETTVWVATGATTELGYRQGGVEIIVDKDTFRVGQISPIMLSVPTNDRYVLFSVEGNDLYSYQLVHVTGTVKLIELSVEEKHVPNIFLSATLVSDRQMFVDSKQIIVPPTKNFITVEVKPDREQYQPQEDGTFSISTRDEEGRPLAAEVSFGLVDESVYYIQSDYAGDPRQFYYGEKRQQRVQTQSTFQQKSYAKLVETENKELLDERDLKARKENGQIRDRSAGEFDYADKDYINGPAGESGIALSRAKTFSVSGRMGGGGGGGGAFGMSAVAAASPMSTMAGNRMDMEQLQKKMPAGQPAGVEGSAVQVRSDFRSTVLWRPDVVTGTDGKATLKVKYPDSLTGWKATLRAVSAANQFGIATTNTRTKMPLIVRLQAPRFFLVGDVVTISAIINNNTSDKLRVTPKLDVEGLIISGLYVGTNGVVKGERSAYVDVEANSEARVDWAVSVLQPGTAKLKVTARGGKYADAMEKTYTIYEHGIEKFVSRSGKVRGNDVTVKLNLPKERKGDSTSLNVQVTPSMAVTMLDALPYLIDYPYGCTEQTMSRFLPAAITAKTLKDLGLQPEDVMGRIFGGIEPGSAAATHPKGKKDLQQLDDMTKASLDRLYDFQHGDGGWGWWKEGDSDHWMTAYVVWGLTLAKDAGLEIKANVIERGLGYLDKTLVEEEENLDTQAFMLHAVSAYYSEISFKKNGPSAFQAKAFENLWSKRDGLNAYTRSLLALSAHYFGKDEQAKILIDNLENGVKRDDKPDTSVIMQGAQQSSDAVIGTAHWGEDGIYWRWSDGGVEATAFALRAMMAIDPTNKLVEPVSNWLVKNRRGAQWSNTRDTAIVVLAMNDYLRASGELSPDLEYELLVNGKSIATKKVSGADVFNAPSQFPVDPKLIRDGDNDIRIVRKGGKGPIYFAANAKYFSLEEPITPAGNEIFVRRQYYKLTGHPTLLKGYVYDRQALNDGESVKSGERVETVVTIEAKNNYEYLLFEDLKPAGLEAVEVRSGESLYAYEMKSGAVDRKYGTNKVEQPLPAPSKPTPKGTLNPRLRRVLSGPGQGGLLPRPAPVTDENHTGRTRWVYQELRDRKVALFLDKLPEGVWEIKYDLRAEVPGQFHALPVVGHAMYVPEIRCNGQEVRITVEDTK